MGIIWGGNQYEIGVNGKTYQSKRFDTLEEAVQSRKEMELKYWGKSSL